MDKDTFSIVSAIALNHIFGNNPKFSHQLLDRFGSPKCLFELSYNELKDLFGPYTKYAELINRQSLDKAEKEYNLLSREGYQIISIFDEFYPSLLRECADAPLILYIRSQTAASELFRGIRSVAIVGTRDLSNYGKEWCTRIVRSLSEASIKPCIISGLAIGTDICAQLASLSFGLPTIGVSPVGINEVYPRRHSVCADKICGSPGSAIITDYPPGTPAMAQNFIRRNRIIAGLAEATILVESKIKGGGMITARLAAEYGRNVYALPGRIDDICSEGCNLLLSEKTAEPISSLPFLIKNLGLGTSSLRCTHQIDILVREQFSNNSSPSELEKLIEIALCIKSRRGISIDALCRECNLSYQQTVQLTSKLQDSDIIFIDMLQSCSVNPKIA